MRFSVETWAPEYGIAADASTLVEAQEPVDPTVEMAVADWAPIAPVAIRPPDRIMFIDGVQRIEARVWIEDDDRVHAGVCASIAAGSVVSCAGRAEVTDVEVRRVLFAAATSPAGSITTKHTTYEFLPARSAEPSEIYLAIHESMTRLETQLAAAPGCELVVFDGPLRGRNDPAGVGYVKTQHVQHLPDALMPILTRLDDGERTPLFMLGRGGFARWSCYTRLPGRRSQPLSGVVRLELPGVGTVQDAVRRAMQVTAALPRFASESHKEPRAPQNLYPIAGLERALRRRLGDQYVLERGLRIAAA